MSERAEELRRHILDLTPSEKIELVDDVLASLDQPDESLDRLWLHEAEDRLAAYRRGDLDALSVEEPLAKYRSP
jgi:putative addiction module component (TIGR02574 family)